MMSNEGTETILTPVDLVSNALTGRDNGLPGGNGACYCWTVISV
jgi:hypothetical protein